MQCLSLLILLGRNILYDRSLSLTGICQFLHKKNVDDSRKSGAGIQRILHGNNLCTINRLQLLDNSVILALFIINLVYDEHHRFLHLLDVAEAVLCTHLNTILAIDDHHRKVTYLHCAHHTTGKIVRARAVDKVKFLSGLFNLEYGREHRVSILLLNREIVTDSILCSDRASTFYNTTLIEHSFSESGFT